MCDGKAMIAMSGGVDSSVAVYLTQREGFSCMGVTALLCGKDLPGCVNAPDPGADAQAVADRLGIELHILEHTESFRRQVVDYFVDSYRKGLTPNPCIRCNRSIKFGDLLDYALAQDCRWIVTGHYARIRHDEATGRYLLYKAADSAKDQSYFLACLTQHQLAHTRFPLGELTKEQVRQIALEQGFINARKRDSQDVCFIPDGDHVRFLKEYLGQEFAPGDYLDLSGKKVGSHKGAIGYTLGQRKGLGLAMGAPVYVCAKDMQANTVTVGPNDALFSTTLEADDCNWIALECLAEPIKVTAKARSRHIGAAATVYPLPDGKIRVVFDEPQRALTPGQTVVLYEEDLVVGSGTITKVL